MRNITMIVDNGSILSLSNICDSAILVIDVDNNFKLIGILINLSTDTDSFNLLFEQENLISGDPILEVLVVESQNEEQAYPHLLCFTKNTLIIMES